MITCKENSVDTAVDFVESDIIGFVDHTAPNAENFHFLSRPILIPVSIIDE